MPELPEVETARRFAERLLTGHCIAKAYVQDDRIVVANCTPRACAAALAGRRVEGVARRGKHLWLELDRRPWVTLHFAMTGRFISYTARKDRPPYTKLELLLDNGCRFAMTNTRRLGRIRVLEDPERSPPISGLGFDPLLDMPGPEHFAQALRRRKTPVKALLLDQSFAAGVGNWIADEVLYQAGIDPRRRAADLAPAEARRIHGRLRRIIRTAVDVEADASRFPKTWLFLHRWGRKRDARTSRGEAIEFLTIGGRTTAWVPMRQS